MREREHEGEEEREVHGLEEEEELEVRGLEEEVSLFLSVKYESSPPVPALRLI